MTLVVFRPEKQHVNNGNGQFSVPKWVLKIFVIFYVMMMDITPPQLLYIWFIVVWFRKLISQGWIQTM